DRALIDEKRGRGVRLPHPKTRELARHQRPVLVVEDRADAHGAALRVHLVVDELEMTAQRRAVDRRRHFDRNALQALAWRRRNVLERTRGYTLRRGARS